MDDDRYQAYRDLESGTDLWLLQGQQAARCQSRSHLPTHLRRQASWRHPAHLASRCQQARKKRYGGRDRRGIIPNQVSIDKRPAVVGNRVHFGDWEADLVIGAGQKQALVTINARASRYSLIAHVPFKLGQAVSDSMISLLTPFATCVHTLTADNVQGICPARANRQGT
ncbi:MAG: IS30 family transposase [Betaproteobacteria bacterium]|nr:IS30 family transposase [Betaproteobacteria bacterium]